MSPALSNYVTTERRSAPRISLENRGFSARINGINYAVLDISRSGFSFQADAHGDSGFIARRCHDLDLLSGRDVIATTRFDVVNETQQQGHIRYGCRFEGNDDDSILAADFDDSNKFFAIRSERKLNEFVSDIGKRYIPRCVVRHERQMYHGVLDKDSSDSEHERLKIIFDKPVDELVSALNVGTNIKCMVRSYGVPTFMHGEIEGINVAQQTLIMNRPSVLYYHKQRICERYYFKDDELVELIVHLPFSGEGESIRVKVRDMSRSGLAFVAEQPLLFFQGLYVKHITLILPEATEINISGTIIYCQKLSYEKYVYGFRFGEIENNQQAHHTIDQFISHQLYPHIVDRREISKNRLFYLFKESGYFMDKTEEAINATWNEAKDTWDKLGSAGGQLSCDCVYVEEEIQQSSNVQRNILGSISMTKIYPSTFIQHHLLTTCKGQKQIKIIRDLYDFILGAFLKQTQHKYSIVYFDSAQLIHRKFYLNALEDLASEENMLVKYYSLYEIEVHKYQSDTCNINHLQFVNISQFDNEIFLDHIKYILKQLEIAAYNYRQDLFLSGSKTNYNLNGLYIDRTIIGVKYSNHYVAFIICEAASTGINIFNLFDQSRLIVLNESVVKQNMNKIVAHMKDYYLEKRKQRFILMIPRDIIFTDTFRTQNKIFHAYCMSIIMSIEGLKFLKMHLKNLFDTILK